MKTILTLLFVNFYLLTNAQVADLLWVPEQKSIVASQRPYYSKLGWYVGGYYTKKFPSPYLYRTPFSIINRIGVNYVGDKQKVSVMAGAFIASKQDELTFEPDVWVKIYPLRILTNTSKGFDFVVAVNYMENFRWGFGISIPSQGIY
jgi:hypothetical protein